MNLLSIWQEKHDSELENVKQQQELLRQQKDRLASKHIEQKLFSSRRLSQRRGKSDEQNSEGLHGPDVRAVGFCLKDIVSKIFCILTYIVRSLEGSHI